MSRTFNGYGGLESQNFEVNGLNLPSWGLVIATRVKCATGWRGRDHWHLNEGEEHLTPGQEIPGGECPELEDKRSLKEKLNDAWENFKDFMEEAARQKPIMPFPLPLPGPIPIPAR